MYFKKFNNFIPHRILGYGYIFYPPFIFEEGAKGINKHIKGLINFFVR